METRPRIVRQGLDNLESSRPVQETPRLLRLLLLALTIQCLAGPSVKPGYLESLTDAETGYTVTRISGDPGLPIPHLSGNRTWSDEVRHHYSLDQAWNADQTLLALDRNRGGCPDLLLNGRTYEVISEMPSFPYESRWHPTDPVLRVYMGGNEIGYLDVPNNRKAIIATFDNYQRLMFGPSKGNVSDDGKMVAVVAQRSDKQWVVFAYNLSTKTKYQDVVLAQSPEIRYRRINTVRSRLAEGTLLRAMAMIRGLCTT